MIKPKEKPCKGSGKAIGYGCGKPQIKRIYGLGLTCKCYSTWLLESEEGRKKLSSVTLKVTKPRQDLEKAIEENKDRIKLQTLIVNVRNVCHEYIRERDKGLPCISCGTPYNTNFQAGHFYKAELFSNLRLDEFNIGGQCRICNLRDEGNESGYRTGIIQRYGEERLHYLDEKAKAYKRNDFKWDRSTLIEIRDYYREKLKQLKSKDK